MSNYRIIEYNAFIILKAMNANGTTIELQKMHDGWLMHLPGFSKTVLVSHADAIDYIREAVPGFNLR